MTELPKPDSKKKPEPKAEQPAPTQEPKPAAVAAAPPEPKDGDMLELFLRIGDKLSKEDRDKLFDLGVVIPLDVDPKLAKTADQSTWGYYCKKCGDIALYFMGSSFLEADGETRSPAPSVHVPIHQIAFAQPDLPRDRINRYHPICQSCCNPIEMRFGKLLTQRIVNIPTWSATKHKKIQEMRKMRVPAHSVNWDPGSMDSSSGEANRQIQRAGHGDTFKDERPDGWTKDDVETVLDPQHLKGALPDTPAPMQSR